MKYCEKCGKEMAEGARFCGNCGAAVRAESSVPNAEVNHEEPAIVDEKARLEELARPLVQNNNVGAPIISESGPIVSETPKRSKIMIVLMSVFSVLCLVVGVTGIVLAVIAHNNEEMAKKEKEKEEAIAAVTGTKVRLDDYELTVSDDYSYEIFNEEGGDIIEYTKDVMTYLVGSMYFDKFTFSTVENNVDVIKESLMTGAESVEAGFKTINDMDFVYFDYHGRNGKNILYAFTEADLYCFMTTLIMKDNSVGIDQLEDVVGLLSSAEKVDGSMTRAFNADGESELNIQDLNNVMMNAIPEDLQ